MPLILIYGGTYAALLAALKMAVDATNAMLPVIVVLGFVALVIGFWQLIVYFASFNRSYANALLGQAAGCDLESKRLLKSHQPKLVWYINGLILVQVIAGIGIWFLTLPLTFFIPENVVGILIQILVYLPYTLVSMGFQVLALGTPKEGAFGVLRQSMQLVKKRFWACFLTLLVCFVLTYYLIPGLAVVLAELCGAVGWFNQFHDGAIYDYLARLQELKGQLPDSLQPLMAQMPIFGSDLHKVSLDASHQLSQTLLTSIVNSLLLPWGTFVYALLYGDLLASEPKEVIAE